MTTHNEAIWRDLRILGVKDAGVYLRGYFASVYNIKTLECLFVEACVYDYVPAAVPLAGQRGSQL